MFLLFFAKHAAILALLLLTAAGAGTLAAGAREGIALRTALGLALFGHACFFLAAIGQLRAAPLIALAVLAIIGGAWRARSIAPPSLIAIASAIGVVPLFVLALYPPLAFDETLYHMPTVRALAHDGALRFLPALRFPVFPQIHEILCVPAFLLGGDVATHLVALIEVIITAALLVDWARRRGTRAGWLAAAFFLGSPLVIYLSTITYVDAALVLFIAAGFYALDRERFLLSGLFFGTACGVKYLGGYFAVAAFLIVLASAKNRRRSGSAFAIACAFAALPTTAWIALMTHDPVFPFLRQNLWALPNPEPRSFSGQTIRILRTAWDVTFARHRMGNEPPVTPWLIPLLAIAAASWRDARFRWILIIGCVYVLIVSFLPRESRYLLPILPLVCAIAAIYIAASWPRVVTILACLAVAPGIAYAGYRIFLLGIPPATPAARAVWLERHVPAYRAVERTGSERVYVCGGEQLKDFAAGELLGDFGGPFSYPRVLGGASDTASIAARLRRIDAHYFLVVKSACAPPRSNRGMTLTYEDEAAQLWRVQP